MKQYFKKLVANLIPKRKDWKTIQIHFKMKVGVAFYYKNIEQYPAAWVNKCIDSMRNQTYNDFDVYVLNYGEREDHSFSFLMGNNYHYLHKPLNNYAEAMNYIYSKIFQDCEVAVNTNIDDYYNLKRIEILLKDLQDGADIASSNLRIINERNEITWSLKHDEMNIYEQLKNGFNPVSNPCHIMKKRVFEKLHFDSTLVPAEDMSYWIKAIEAGFKIVINPQYLHYYRMHPNQSTHKR